MTGYWWWPRGRVSRRALAMLYLLPALCTVLLLDLLARYEHDAEIVRAVALVCFWGWAGPLAVGLMKRLHDCGRSGLWAGTVLVPFAGVVVFAAIVFAAAGQASANKYGQPPFELTDAPR